MVISYFFRAAYLLVFDFCIASGKKRLPSKPFSGYCVGVLFVKFFHLVMHAARKLFDSVNRGILNDHCVEIAGTEISVDRDGACHEHAVSGRG